ncbi:potassium channel subfamily K member 18-like protein [Dinothrombium tinctorium]|uniref:Potassium channel subfamily K member 18-like protein n=1 Tax=Dinothrombium tinctorium TaxID=1965070 RepID=A0A443QUS7_9ACAR|nr:potassium channel subfamily K member 18-like protein [Dinothrombium tinctorium]
MFSLMCSNFGLFALVVGYSYIGAYVFRHFEGPYETGLAAEVNAMRDLTILRLWNITNKYNILYRKNWTSMVTSEIVQFQRQLIQAVRDGYDGKDSVDNQPQQWSISSAFLYSLTVITTIGKLVLI